MGLKGLTLTWRLLRLPQTSHLCSSGGLRGGGKWQEARKQRERLHCQKWQCKNGSSHSEPPHLASRATLEPQAVIWLSSLTKMAQLDGFWLGAEQVATLWRIDKQFIKLSGMHKAFHRGGNSSCCLHIHQHYTLYKERCEKGKIPVAHWVIPWNIWKAMEKDKEAEIRAGRRNNNSYWTSRQW